MPARTESVADQTRLVLADLEKRLSAAGSDKTNVIDAVVFRSDISTLSEMDKVWVEMIHSTGRALLSKFHYPVLSGSAAAAGPPLTG